MNHRTPRRAFGRFARHSLLLAIPTLVMASTADASPPLAFPGAEGFGAVATGGRGGSVYHVTTLDDAGPGSLRDALSQPNRTVVFEVGGVIKLASPMRCSSNVTIAGQTAPGGGITLSGHSISFSEQQNIIVRYLRLRSSIAASRGSKPLNVSRGSRMIFDHVSVSWGRWDNLGFTQQSSEITLQDCLLGEAIDPQRFGALIDSSTNITVVRNLWTNHQSRNPKGKAHMQYVNNVIYNWGSGGYCGGHSAAVWNQDIVGNYFIAGPSTRGGFLIQFTGNDHVHHKGNLVDLDRDGALNGREVVDADFKPNERDGPTATFKPEAYNKPSVPITVLSAEAAYERVLKEAGASLKRDEVDTRLIEQVRSLGASGAVIKSEEEVGGVKDHEGGTAPADTDRDGIADEWERTKGLNPADAADANAIAGDTGYTNLETYLNSLVPAAGR